MPNPLLDLNARLVIAHRGNRVAAPENTIEALRQAVEMGVDGLEFDVRVTRDGIPVLMHDPDLDRTTNARGRVVDHSLHELQSVDAGARSPGWAGRGVRIPTLEEVLDAFRETPMVVEVKVPGAAEPTERLVRTFGARARVVIGSSERGVMSRFTDSDLDLCASIEQALQLLPTALLRRTPRLQRYQVLSLTDRFYGVPVPILAMTAAATRVGIPTHVWTVNDPRQAVRLWDAGVAAILSDDPAALLRARTR